MNEQKERPGQRYVRVGEQNLSNLDHVDWSKAPRTFKLYRNCPQIALGYAGWTDGPGVQQHHSPGPQEQAPTRAQIGQFLFHIYGITRQCRVTSDALRLTGGAIVRADPATPFLSFLRRPVPAGGGLFPCEIYILVGSDQNLPAGVYHYDAIHHALDILRVGDYTPLLQTCLTRCVERAPNLALVLSCSFWKSGYKYIDFSYRLHSLDAGVVIGQSLLLANDEAWEPTVHFRYLDRQVNHLLGLNDAYESVYAILSLHTRSAASQEQAVLPPLPIVESLHLHVEPGEDPAISLAQWPLLAELHAASLITTACALKERRHLPSLAVPTSDTYVTLPRCAPLDLRSALHRRHSALLYFQRGEIAQHQLSTLLVESTRGYSNDLDGSNAVLQHTLLYCVINAVTGIQPGIYVYHPERHALNRLSEGDMRAALQSTLLWFSYNIWNVSLCLFPVVHYEQGFTLYGDRWYRIQNMEAGILIQRLYLASAALSLGCQVHLGYSTRRVHELLRLPEEQRCLAQILVGPEQQAGQYLEQALW